jgi:serine/threonine protein phosphatase PrpC
MKQIRIPPIQPLVKRNVLVNWKEYFDNDCKGEDMWGHYKTSNGDLYVVADGASSHDGSKTGGDVARFIDERLKQDTVNITRSHHLKELIHAINTESTRKNEGAYAAIAGILYRGNRIFSISAGDVSIIAKKPNGKLLQVLPLDLSMEREEAEICVKADLHYKNFHAKDGAAILIASDGITDPFMKSQKGAGNILKTNAPRLYEIMNSCNNEEDAAEALKNLIWDTQVKEKKKIKPDDRTGLFLYMNYPEGG